LSEWLFAFLSFGVCGEWCVWGGLLFPIQVLLLAAVGAISFCLLIVGWCRVEWWCGLFGVDVAGDRSYVEAFLVWLGLYGVRFELVFLGALPMKWRRMCFRLFLLVVVRIGFFGIVCVRLFGLGGDVLSVWFEWRWVVVGLRVVVWEF